MTHKTNYPHGTRVLLKAFEDMPEEEAIIQEKQEKYSGMYYITIDGADCEVHENQIKEILE